MPRARMIASLLILGGAVFGVLGTMHAVYTFLDLRNPRRLVPVDPAVARAMANSPLRLSGGRTDMWRAWIGFNFSHSLGLLIVAALALWAGSRTKALPVGIMPALTLIGCVYVVLALLYWFRAPAIGVAIGTGCFAAAWVLSLRSDEANNVRPFEPKEYKAILAAIAKTELQPRNKARTKACMQLQRWSGLSIVDAVCLSKNELQQTGKVFRVRTQRRKTGTHINNVIPSWLGKELLRVKNGNPTYFFISGEATTKGAVSTVDKMYRQVFTKAGVDGTSHMFRHTFSVELLNAGVDIRKVSRALGHSSVTITERYYAKWNKAQQDILDGDLTRAWK